MVNAGLLIILSGGNSDHAWTSSHSVPGHEAPDALCNPNPLCLSSLLLLFLRGCLFSQSRAMSIQNIWQLVTHDYELLS